MTLDVVILAGGKGTRIRKVLHDTPKILAPIEGKPFLDWLLAWIDSWNLNTPKNITLSTCVGHELIQDYCRKKFLNVKCLQEQKPLGTLGALANVASTIKAKNYLVMNGDTIFKADFQKFYKRFCLKEDSKPLIILKKVLENDRYGGYEKINKYWKFSNQKTEFISLGAFFITGEELKKRWISSTRIPFNVKHINESSREYMIDDSLFGNKTTSGEVLDLKTPFIDIGVPSTLKEAQSFIPKIINLK